MSKYTVNYTREDNIYLLRKEFLEAYLEKHLNDNPDIKRQLEDDFQQLVKEEEV